MQGIQDCIAIFSAKHLNTKALLNLNQPTVAMCIGQNCTIVFWQMTKMLGWKDLKRVHSVSSMGSHYLFYSAIKTLTSHVMLFTVLLTFCILWCFLLYSTETRSPDHLVIQYQQLLFVHNFVMRKWTRSSAPDITTRQKYFSCPLSVI